MSDLINLLEPDPVLWAIRNGNQIVLAELWMSTSGPIVPTNPSQLTACLELNQCFYKPLNSNLAIENEQPLPLDLAKSLGRVEGKLVQREPRTYSIPRSEYLRLTRLLK